VRPPASLKSPADFARVRKSGKSYAHPLLVLVAQANDQMNIRVGLAASRALGTAVKRNRARRLLREAMRALLPCIPSGWDLVLIARPGLAASNLDETRKTLNALLNRAGLILH
jgi:ribonuclease P protein component